MKPRRMIALAVGIGALWVAPSFAAADESGKKQIKSEQGVTLSQCQNLDQKSLTEQELADMEAQCAQLRQRVSGTEEAPTMQPTPTPYPYQQRQEVTVQPRVIVPQQPVRTETKAKGPMTRFGTAIAVGGGVTHFSEGRMRDVTDAGGVWDARVILGTRSPIAVEAAYVGTAQGMDAVVGLDSSAYLLSNGAEGNLRVNLGTFAIQPFVFGGGSWVHYNIQNSDFNTSSISNDDDVFALPFGGGISGRYRGALLDTRFTYRQIWGDESDLLRTPTGSSADVPLSNWAASARVGFEF